MARAGGVSLVLVTGFSIILLAGCNIFEGFASPSSDEEYVQEGQKCLRSGDYACALENFGHISATDLKNEKVCLAQLSRTGMGVTELVSVVASGSTGAKMLGRIAAALMPWTEEKETAAVAAITECNKLSTVSDTHKQSLLRVLAYLVDCGVRMAKTDIYVSVSDTVTSSCNSTTAGDGDGRLESSDVAEDETSALGAGNKGMCPFDAHACTIDLDTANTLSGGLGSELGGVSGNLTNVPADLKNSSATYIQVRTAIIDTI